MKKREIFIVIALIAFGIIYNSYKSGDFEISFYEGCSVDSRSLLDKRSLTKFVQEEIRCSHDDIKKVEIENLAGSITVEKHSAIEGKADSESEIEKTIRIVPEIHVYHRDVEKAHEIYKKIKIESRTYDLVEGEEPGSTAGTGSKPTYKKLHITVSPEESFPYRRVRVHFKLTIPESAELDLWNRYGNMEINGCGKNILLNGKYGDIWVRHIDSNLKIRHRHGNVAVGDIKDAVDLSSRYSKIKIKDVSELKLNCSHSRVFIAGVKKETDIDHAAYSVITMEDSQKITLDGRHTKIKMENIEEGASVKNSHETIYMQNVKGNVQVKARHCKVVVKQAVSDDVVVKNSYGSVWCDEISAKNVDIMLNNGKLDIAFDRIEERINIRNRYSRIRLEYPQSLQPLFSIHVRHGNIVNRTPVEMAILKEGSGAAMNASTMEGKPEIIINNTYGDVFLKTSSTGTTPTETQEQKTKPTTETEKPPTQDKDN
ncbi:MAG: DUF4097 family beta strand repeat protein [Candidatus Aminicenantes bacterium]|nr:DUF4097 family beta strand repeat protein [Candidatus Aminicenantes bacterium]NIM77929.1 DUF4097 family beta strand repeat protein [Candidatus Aminicenantes bacterium]NIN22746.1 DUF4097 family beta strand repeat protein [Candidatus Aminicenantes bacterium]NIN45912.1 DUF4097 family beta strand repeat protein [Candidatus Aminicenantes bacterium]NIN89388.1 DUF4097 family beta strand repeat protein [Candidatus Aminicenantes bacterium]